MTAAATSPKGFKLFHNVSTTLLLLMIVQPTFDNVRGMLAGNMSYGDITIQLTLINSIGPVLGTVMGWIGWWWFLKRQKKGAYLTIAAHTVGFVSAITQMPELLFAMMPAWGIAVFFVIMLGITLGPVLAYKDQYS